MKKALLTLPFLTLAACMSASEPTSQSGADLTAPELQYLVPPGSYLETQVLALVNENVPASSYVTTCHFSQEQADAIVSYRRGDDATSVADDQTFTSTAQVDALPFTDADFWHKAVACALNPPAPTTSCGTPTMIELVVDESGSMTTDGKWEALRAALLSTLDAMKTSPAGSLYVGAVGFDDHVVANVPPMAFVDPSSWDGLKAAIDRETPDGGGTSTEIALATAYRTVSLPTPVPNMKKIVVLLSDGVPSGGAAEQQNVISLVSSQLAAGVSTYAVGIGPFPTSDPNMYDPAFMGDIAIAGGTAPAGCQRAATDPSLVCHYQITPGTTVGTTQSLADALGAIRRNATCP